MNKAIIVVLVPLVAAGLVGLAQAQGGTASDSAGSAATTGAMSGHAAGALQSGGEHQVRRASRVMGADVVDPQGRKIGDIKDVVFDPVRGQIAYAVVGFGGLMGMGTRYYPVPWAVLHQPYGAGDRFTLDMTREQLRNAPSFDRNQWPDMTTDNWNRDVARFYAQAPYWEGNPGVGANRGASGSTMGGSGSGTEPAGRVRPSQALPPSSPQSTQPQSSQRY